MDVFDAAERYRGEGRQLIILAGKDYGSGSSRDWAAKGPWMLVCFLRGKFFEDLPCKSGVLYPWNVFFNLTFSCRACVLSSPRATSGFIAAISSEWASFRSSSYPERAPSHSS